MARTPASSNRTPISLRRRSWRSFRRCREADGRIAAAMDDRFELQRFVDAQQPIYETVLSELRAGRKRSHWMWFIFPQISGLGHSSTAQMFAVSSLAEAAAYLAHPILGPRLRECAALVASIEQR